MGNIGKLFVVAKREYMERIRSRWFIVMTLLVPAIFSGAMLFPVYVAARSSASGGALRNIAILDASGTGLGEQIATTLKTDTTLGRPDGIEPRVIVATTAELPAKERELQTQVEQPNSLVGYLVLTDSTLTNNVASYSGRNASTINDIDKLRTIVRQDVMIARLQREGVRADVVKDLATKKPLTLKIESDSTMKKLPEQAARMLARRYAPGAQQSATEAGAPGRGGRGGGGDAGQMIDRLPAMPLAELKPGDAIMVSTTQGSEPGRATVITLLAGVEPLLTASPTATRDIMSGWNLGGGGGDSGQ